MQSARTFVRLLSLVASLSFSLGCEPDAMAPVAPTLLSTSVDDAADGVTPTLTIELTFSTPLDADSVDATAIAVVEGVADTELAHTLATDGATEAILARLVPGAVVVDGSSARYQPLRPLAGDTLHTLIVSSSLRAEGLHLVEPALRPFTTGAASTGAPTCALVDPVEGAVEVVRNLRAVEVIFSRAVTGVTSHSLLLVGSRGAAATTITSGNCPSCFLIAPTAPLDPNDAFRVLALDPIADAWGEPPFPVAEPPAFATGTVIRTKAPAITSLTATSSSGCLVARWSTDVGASSSLCVNGDCVVDASLLETHEIAGALVAGSAADFSISSRDESTAPAATRGPLPAPASSPRTLTISEVLSHPRGPRLAQQFVELWNRGALPIATDGLELDDELGASQLPSATIPAGGYALVVPANFSVDDGLDVAPLAGALLLRVADDHLGGNGIRESGEAIALVEADGRPVSRFSTYGLKELAGQSATRVGPCDIAASYQVTPGGTATPGGP